MFHISLTLSLGEEMQTRSGCQLCSLDVVDQSNDANTVARIDSVAKLNGYILLSLFLSQLFKNYAVRRGSLFWVINTTLFALDSKPVITFHSSFKLH